VRARERENTRKTDESERHTQKRKEVYHDKVCRNPLPLIVSTKSLIEKEDLIKGGLIHLGGDEASTIRQLTELHIQYITSTIDLISAIVPRVKPFNKRNRDPPVSCNRQGARNRRCALTRRIPHIPRLEKPNREKANLRIVVACDIENLDEDTKTRRPIHKTG